MSRALGAESEARAAQLLQRKGYLIADRNWTCRGGEIDLVCLDGDTLVFVEVRARKDSSHGSPLETVGGVKRRRLIRAAKIYLHEKQLWEKACRFDVVAIDGDEVTHLEDAFQTTS
ncbi:MAG: hypothetical protein JWN44_5970 [Myxococcales bacterium]|nr:hypothetical protein [Myxococcales bacterium]